MSLSDFFSGLLVILTAPVWIPVAGLVGLSQGIYSQLFGESVVVFGEKSAGKSALLWQLGFIKDKAEDPINGFDPKMYIETSLDPQPLKVEFKKSGTYISKYQDTNGSKEQRDNGNLLPYINDNDIIVIVFDGAKFLRELPHYNKICLKGNDISDTYVSKCMGIFSQCFHEVKKYNEGFFSYTKKIITIASHLDEYEGNEEHMKNEIKRWAHKKGYKSLFDSNFVCMTLNDKTLKEENQKKFLNLLT